MLIVKIDMSSNINTSRDQYVMYLQERNIMRTFGIAIRLQVFDTAYLVHEIR